MLIILSYIQLIVSELENAEFAYKDGVYYCLAKCSDKQDEQKIKDQCRVVMIHQ